MRISTILLAFAGMGAYSASVTAAPIYYDCDTASDSFSELKWPITASGLVVTGKIVPVRFREGRFLPVANLHLRSGDSENYLAIRLIAENSRSKGADILLESVNNDQKKEGALGQLKRSDVMPFSIRHVAADQFIVTVNDRKFDVEVQLGDKLSISMTCSTGQFQFQDIQTSSTAR